MSTSSEAAVAHPTREDGLQALADFQSSAGRQYTEHRNYDLGRGNHSRVSRLSPYLSHRLITESEVVHAVLKEHKPKDCESFVQEVCWRTYWKGWLEGRPQVYSSWLRLLAEDRRRWPEREDYQAAVAGKTGIECFDYWVNELKETGYLHNHARMWFASIWIFTLKLPWSLGAGFFLEHLLDGDAASNTLSWRWVAGLQTKGKNYVASAGNIRKFTKGRFDPEGQLAESPEPLQGPPNPGYALPVSYPFKASEQLGENYALLITGDDLASEVGPLAEYKPKHIFTLSTEDLGSSISYSQKVLDFKTSALQDAGTRASHFFGCPVSSLVLADDPAAELGKLMKEKELDSLLYFEPFIGEWKELTNKMSSRDVGVKFFPLRRPWDGLLHPHAVKGYFHFKKHIFPQVLRAQGVFSSKHQ